MLRPVSKKFFLTSILVLGLLGCTNSEVKSDDNSNNNLELDNTTFPIEMGTFTTDELFAAGGGGCPKGYRYAYGMSLWQPDTNPQQEGFLFFKGLEDTPAFMIFDGKITNLARTNASGDKFYGQQTEQVFTTEDKAIAVKVNVDLGTEGEIESVVILSGEIKVGTQGKTEKLYVVGDAGC